MSNRWPTIRPASKSNGEISYARTPMHVQLSMGLWIERVLRRTRFFAIYWKCGLMKISCSHNSAKPDGSGRSDEWKFSAGGDGAVRDCELRSDRIGYSR